MIVLYYGDGWCAKNGGFLFLTSGMSFYTAAKEITTSVKET